MAPATVLHVIEHMHLGGRETALARLVRGLDRTRFTPIVATFLPGDLGDGLAAEGIPVIRVDVRPKHRRIGALERLIRDRGVDLVHTHMFSAGTYGRAAAIAAGVRGIVHTHATLSFRERPWKTYLPEAAFTAFTDRVICVSRAVRDHLARFLPVYRDRLVVIPNGLAIEAFGRPAGAPKGFHAPPRIVGVGRLEPVKGFDVLIRALGELRRGGVDFQARLVGDGSERAALEALAASQGVAEHVEFLGHRNDVAALLAEADLYVAPSHREGLSNAVLEAMGAALPIVATRVGGNPELLEPIGELVPPADPAAMADAIRRTLADPAAARARGDAARAEIERNYTLSGVVRRHEELYTELLERRPALAGSAA